MTSRENTRACANCGQPLAASASFCRHCGAQVEQAAAQSSPTPPAPATAPSSRRKGPSSTILIALVVGLAVGAGAVAAVALVGGEEDSEPVAVAPGSAATVPTGEAPPATKTGQAESKSGPAGFPAESESQMAQEIQALLLAYHEDIVASRFQDAWSLLSARKRRQTEREDGYRKWARAQASLSPYLSPAGLTVRIDALEDEGVARVFVTGMDWAGPGSPCTEWSGLTWAKYEGGAWAYDPGYSTTPERERTWKPRYGELLGANC